MTSKAEITQTINVLCRPYIAHAQFQIYENSIGFVSAARITFHDDSFQLFDSHDNSIRIGYDKSIAILVSATGRGVSLLVFDTSFNDYRLIKETFIFNA